MKLFLEHEINACKVKNYTWFEENQHNQKILYITWYNTILKYLTLCNVHIRKFKK